MSLPLSHVHAIIAFSTTGKSINSIAPSGKRFIAYDLVKRLQQPKGKLIFSELFNEIACMKTAMYLLRTKQNEEMLRQKANKE